MKKTNDNFKALCKIEINRRADEEENRKKIERQDFLDRVRKTCDSLVDTMVMKKVLGEEVFAELPNHRPFSHHREGVEKELESRGFVIKLRTTVKNNAGASWISDIVTLGES
jgi:hypothetical protein